jgi:hypothetical protein
MKTRQDGLVVGEPFFVIQCFDREGYYTSQLATSEDDARKKISKMSPKTVLVATSLPFPGTWSGVTPDITMPADFKEALSSVDRPSQDS